MALNFDKHASKGNEFINRLAAALNVSKEQAGRILSVFFRALRNPLTTEQSFQLLAQLPMALKALYVDQWEFHQYHKRVRTAEEFITGMMMLDRAASRDIPNWTDGI